MAITTADVLIWQRLRDEGKLPKQPSILEIGEGNWYGDYPLDQLAELAGPDVRRLYESRDDDPEWLFKMAELFYRSVLGATWQFAIDLDGTGKAVRLDLNYPVFLDAGPDYDIVINTGTAEHVWNVAQVFRTCHEACKTGGLMFHCLPPFRGWIDHGFWNINPTAILDLEAANGYERLACMYFEVQPPRVVWLEDPMKDLHKMARARELGDNALLYVVWKRTSASTFRVPMQGQYAERLTEEQKQDWKEMR